MPADNHDSDCSSLNWEDYFGSSNSELLPSLLSVYDSIAAARKLEETEPGTERLSHAIPLDVVAQKSSTDEILAISGDAGNARYTAQQSRETASKEPSWCSPPKIDDCSSPCMRPNSCTSTTSVSSQWSVCSHESSSASENSSICCAENEHQERSDGVRKSRPVVAVTTDTERKSFIYDTSGDDSILRGSAHEPPIRTSCTTESQYSEDSGIYSNFVRSDSLHERSWFYADGDDANYMNRVIQEIVESEFVYVDDLQQVITGYMDEWRNDNSCPLSMEQIHDLFGNIEEIYNFHRCFLWELEQCGLDSVKIARCFVENNSNFSFYYVIYCTRYPKSISILTKLMRQDKTAHIFRDRQIRLQHTLPLGSYLLKPVQRITKYHLLLENMVKHASPEMVGYNDLTVALSTMTGIAHHINTMKRRHEHAVRVQEVQSLLTNWQGPDLTTFGELYAEGSFRISGAKASRHIFLFEHMLLVTKKKEAGILNYKTHILCSNLMLVECIPKELLSFQIIPFDNPRMQFTVHARSREEKRYWTLELKRVILENYSVEIPSHARQLVMELGQIQNLKDVSAVKITPKRQYSTPDYLERRKVDKDKRKSVKSRLLPLFRRSESLQNDKMRSKLKKNQSLSESSIFSDNSVCSDKSSLNDSDLQNLSKTTEDLSQACCTMTRTLKGLTTCSVDNGSLSETVDDVNSSSNSEVDERSSYQQKEKLIEEIIGQLLIASQKFQKAIKEHERSVRLKRLSLDSSHTFDQSVDSEDDDYPTDGAPTPVLKYATSAAVNKETSELNTSSESLSASLRVLVPMSPNVWLKQQREHLATPQKKADSLPRTFQLPEEEWRAVRPKTIASDKPSRMNNLKLFGNEETSSASWLTRKKDSFISIPYFGSQTMHPDCKFYRTSVVRMTFNKMVHTISEKWLTKRSKSERSYKVEHKMRACSRSSKYTAKASCEENAAKPITATYKQGSSDLGARIAHAQEISDYADPKVLFPTITPSKKAASLLGVRVSPPEVHSTSQLRPSSEMRESPTDSFYEKQFEEVEAQFDEAIRGSMREASKDVDEVNDDIGHTFRAYSRINVKVSFHKLIKIPPPVPLRPPLLRSISNLEEGSLVRLRSQTSTCPVIRETNIPTKGWVQQVVDRFQCANE